MFSFLSSVEQFFKIKKKLFATDSSKNFLSFMRSPSLGCPHVMMLFHAKTLVCPQKTFLLTFCIEASYFCCAVFLFVFFFVFTRPYQDSHAFSSSKISSFGSSPWLNNLFQQILFQILNFFVIRSEESDSI